MRPGTLLQFLTGRPCEPELVRDASLSSAVPGTVSQRKDIEPVRLDFPGHLSPRFDHVLPACREATDAILSLVPKGEYERLALHSPGLKGYDWAGYISLSLMRVVRAVDALERAGIGKESRVLDFGSYFGNFALAARKQGYRVDAIDSYRDYEPALVQERALLEENGITVIDSSGWHDILDSKGIKYDVVFLMGVIEHIPHSPKPLLEYVCRQLKPGGLLILDTPNIAYAYRRRQLARGESVHPPVNIQFHCPQPFEGHHREFTCAEVEWMLGEVGFGNIRAETFNYSCYWTAELNGEDAEIFRAMEADPFLREVIFVEAVLKPSNIL